MRRRASLCGGPTPPCRPLAGTLQSLLHSPPAWHYLASQQHRRKGGCGGGFCMHCELERLAEQYRGGARYFAPRALVQLHLPVNAIHLSDFGYLAAASDAEQLTFIDLLK